MAITQYTSHDGKTLWKVSVCVRSPSNPSIRVQKAKYAIESFSDAQKISTKLLRECERDVLEKETQGASWGNLVEAWEEFQGATRSDLLSATTRSDYVASLRKHTTSWWKRAATDISRADVREVLNQMEAFGASISYQNKMKVIINRIFVYGMESGLLKHLSQSPAYGISLGREEKKMPEILTIGEIRTLLETARRTKHAWYPVWAMALLTGMRNGELYALQWSDVDWENQIISVTKSYNCRSRAVKSTKSGDWRTVPISSGLMDLLKELKASSRERKEILPRLPGWSKGDQARQLRIFCMGARLPSVKFHTLRACFATQLIRNGVPPIQIQKICGWKDLETMQRYIRLAGIEITGVTETLKILPEPEITAQVVNLFTRQELVP